MLLGPDDTGAKSNVDAANHDESMTVGPRQAYTFR